jgi:hypothetical protein
MNSFAANLTTFPPMISFLNQLLIGRQVSTDVFLLGLDWFWTVTLTTGWIETDYRTNIAAVTNYAFRKPSFVTLMTHNSKTPGRNITLGISGARDPPPAISLA